ncbi:MAG: thiamine-monophosphate kinase [Chthoniobacter sp.]|nr:thiamine-monophosphate kinase [Chthoniobacter sp.]
MKLRGYGEDRLVTELLRDLTRGKKVIVGAGDDCAVLGRRSDRVWQLLKTDCVVEGIHFRPDEDRRRVGWKALARALSDIAAMGGEPHHALITVAISAESDVRELKAIYAGLNKCARRFGVGIVGGETSRSPGPLFLSIAMTGEVKKGRCVLRSGGKAGDELFVTGRLGGSISGRHLDFVPRLKEAQWLTKNYRLHAMMDLSDGLGADLPRLASASGVGFEIDESSLPIGRGTTIPSAMSDGEDYELLFAVAPRDSEKLQRAWRRKFPKLPLTRVGRLCSLATPRKAKRSGFDHFA